MTPPSVARAERTAKFFIYTGGFGTIVAVALIFIFLVGMVLPLFGGSETGEEKTVVTKSVPVDTPLGIGCDEYRTVAFGVQPDGSIRTLDFATGQEIGTLDLLEGKQPTAYASTKSQTEWIFGFEDGSVRFLKIGFKERFIEREDLPEEHQGLAVGEHGRLDDGVVVRTPSDQFRFTALEAELGDAIKAARSPIVKIDLSFPPSGKAFAALTRDKGLTVATIEKRPNMMTGKMREVAKKTTLPYEVPDGRALPEHLKLTGGGNELFLIWKDGFCIRYDARRLGDDGNPVPDDRRRAEMLNLVDDGAEVRSVQFLIGKTTLLVGDNAGTVHAWFTTRPEGKARTSVDGIEMASARSYEGPRSAVRSLSVSRRSRMFMAGYENGEARVFQATRNATLAEVKNSTGAAADCVALAPKEDSLILLARTGLFRWEFDAGHHDVSMSTMFAPIWYEGETGPTDTWQSTGGEDSEPKLGLMPLIFGTLKATFYSMLMAIPLALLAAIYTSEFLKPSVRTPVKSSIEMMASLPSVVLGFLAALVVAPFVADVLPATLAALLTIPFSFLLGARLWQMLPSDTALRLSGLPKFIALASTLPIGILLASWVGPVMESVFFGGDIQKWLNQEEGVGGATGGWVFLLTPLCVLVLAFLWGRHGAPRVRSIGFDWSGAQSARFDVARFGAMIVAGLLLATLVGWLIAQMASTRATASWTATRRATR